MKPERSAALMILGAGLLFSTGGAAIKGCSFGAWEVAGLRSAIAAVVLLVLVPQSRRGWSPTVFLVAIAHAATLVLFVAANKYTTAANTIFLQSTAPLWVLLAGPFLLHEPIRRRDLLVIAMLAVGMGLFFVGVDQPSASAPDPAFGDMLAAAAGLTWAATLLGLRAVGRRGTDHRGADRGGGERAAAAAAIGCLLSALVAIPMVALGGFDNLAQGSGSDWATVVYLGVFQVGLAYVLISRGVVHAPAFLVALLLMVEPICNPIWAYALHGEQPRALSILGGAVIATALCSKALLDRRAPTQG